MVLLPRFMGGRIAGPATRTSGFKPASAEGAPPAGVKTRSRALLREYDLSSLVSKSQANHFQTENLPSHCSAICKAYRHRGITHTSAVTADPRGMPCPTGVMI